MELHRRGHSVNLKASLHMKMVTFERLNATQSCTLGTYFHYFEFDFSERGQNRGFGSANEEDVNPCCRCVTVLFLLQERL